MKRRSKAPRGWELRVCYMDRGWESGTEIHRAGDELVYISHQNEQDQQVVRRDSRDDRASPHTLRMLDALPR